ncbi:FAD/NAD(P)-binding oxidoreductase [Streptomyces sp. NPDC046915]|uniref:NAD(P)/FAD-dependent oxidoreductase n=1 Tax=Streptomyces sp. NPDC046915 TaxID=3155257 RepID=UPI0033FBC131
MTTPAHVLIVGASVAGLATAETLRRRGYEGRLTLLDAESRPLYDRPPLSKGVLSGTWPPDRALLRTPEALQALGAEFVLGDPAVALDVASRTVHTASGRVLRADAVVLATGARPRTPPGQEASAGVHVLRTLDDALALRAGLLTAPRTVVVGDGVLGAEIAATARAMGVDVTLAGPQRAPLESRFGSAVAGELAALHLRHGVVLRLGTPVDGLTRHDGKVTGVRLHDGGALPADLVVVAVGAAPATDWLDGSGLRLDDGVVCDAHCRAADGVYAVGDVARWHHAGAGEPWRLENRTNAVEQAAAVAANLLGERRPYTPVPYFWTEQFDARIHVYGHPGADAEVSVVEGSLTDRRFVALYRRAGRVTAVLGWNMPKQARLHRQTHLADPAHAPTLTPART